MEFVLNRSIMSLKRFTFFPHKFVKFKYSIFYKKSKMRKSINIFLTTWPRILRLRYKISLWNIIHTLKTDLWNWFVFILTIIYSINKIILKLFNIMIQIDRCSKILKGKYLCRSFLMIFFSTRNSCNTSINIIKS